MGKIVPFVGMDYEIGLVVEIGLVMGIGLSGGTGPVVSLTYIFQVLYVLCFTWTRYQVSVYRTIGPLVFHMQEAGSEVIKLFSCSTQLRSKFILLINVKMPTIVGILTFISRING